MREIKFRGKDIMDDHWVYGDLHVLCDRPHIHTGQTVYPYAGRRSFVDPATVGQFTGMFDEDGREIYEGDIVKVVEEFDDENVYTRNGVICFEEGIFELQDKDGKHFAYLGWLMHNESITKLEIVGNIHDNKSLLEKGGNQ